MTNETTSPFIALGLVVVAGLVVMVLMIGGVRRIKSLAGRVKKRAEGLPEVAGYSFPYGVPLVFYPLILFGAYQGIGRWWGWILQAGFFLVIGLFLVTALRQTDYEKIHAQYPELNRLTWVLNYLIFFVGLPVIVWTLLFLI